MAQISKGDTFVDGQQVTGARLNQLVDSSTLLVGAITDQPNLTANTLEATDSTIVNDAGVLKEATIGDILGSNIPVATSAIVGGAGVDITITPAATKKVDIVGAFEADSINSVGNASVGGNATVGGNTIITGNLAVTGTSTLTGNVSVTGSLSAGGVAVQKSIGVAFLSRKLTRGVQHFISPALAWVDLPYNAITEINPFVVNASSFTGVLSSTGSSIITLPAGTYIFEAEASEQSGGGGSDIVTRLFNNTTGNTIEFGRQTTLAGYVNSHSHLFSIFTLSVTTDVKVQVWVTNVANTNNPLTGLSVPAPSHEVVFTAKVMKFV
jgi:hypothetical protein